jgi:hypothetical protein
VKVWVIDTSSIIDLRHLPGKTNRSRNAVFDALTEFVEQGRLFYPPQVLAEVLRFGASVAQKWAKDNEEKATRYKPVYADIKPILARVRNLVDYAKPNPTDQGDPYVIVVAQKLEANGHQPTIITEDRKKQQKKTPPVVRSGCLWVPFSRALRVPRNGRYPERLIVFREILPKKSLSLYAHRADAFPPLAG